MPSSDLYINDIENIKYILDFIISVVWIQSVLWNMKVSQPYLIYDLDNEYGPIFDVIIGVDSVSQSKWNLYYWCITMIV